MCSIREDRKYVVALVAFGGTERLFSDAERVRALFGHFNRLMSSQSPRVKTQLADFDARTGKLRTTSRRGWSEDSFVNLLTSCESDESRLFEYVDVRRLGQPPADPTEPNQPLALCQIFGERECRFAKYVAVFAQELLPNSDSLFREEIAALSKRFPSVLSVYTYRDYWYQQAPGRVFQRCIEDLRSEEIYRAMHGQEPPTVELINEVSITVDEKSGVETGPWYLLA